MPKHKKSRTSRTSKGERPSIKSSTLKSVARDVKAVDKAANLAELWRRGKNPWVTVANTDKNTMKAQPWIRMKSNEAWGNPNQKRKATNERSEATVSG